MIESGIYPHLSNEDYHGDKNSLSRSSLKDFHRNPYYYHAMHLNVERPPKEPTRDMILGSAFHTFILENHLFDKEYAIEPFKVLLKDVGREAYDAYKAECEILEKTKKIILSLDEYNTLLRMRETLERDQRVRSLITDGEIEKSFFWKDERSGLIVKARPDVLHHNMIIDLKTCADASPGGFQRAMADGWYHIQGAMIRDAVRVLEGRTINTVINICVEKKYPYCVGIYIIDELALDHGEVLYKQLLFQMKDCIETQEFKDYPIQTIGLPKWAMGL
jgi:exodeoxyribonuclease VIII